MPEDDQRVIEAESLKKPISKISNKHGKMDHQPLVGEDYMNSCTQLKFGLPLYKRGSSLVLLLLALSLFSHTAMAQESDEDYLEKILRTATPSLLSPEAAVFMNYVSFPEVSNTGVPNIEHPIYELTDRDLSLNISLFYNPNSLKVDSRASWVGTGWGLNSGGMISRQVRDKPDDVNYYSNSPLRANGGGIITINTGWLTRTSKTAGRDIANFPNITGALTHLGLPRQAGYALNILTGPDNGNNALDLEPDIFSVNLEGVSFDFMFNEYGVPKVIEGANDWVIEYDQQDAANLFSAVDYYGDQYTYGHYVNSRIIRFRLKSPTGYEYIFEDIEYTTKYSRYATISSLGPLTQVLIIDQQEAPHATSWYLSQIVSPNGNTMDFTYTDNTLNEVLPEVLFGGFCEPGENCALDNSHRNMFTMTQNIKEKYPPATFQYALTTRDENGLSNNIIDGNTVDFKNRFTIKTKVLSKISSDNVEANFLTSALRQDLTNGVQLNNITVKDKINNVFVKNFSFDYSYKLAVTTDPSVPAEYNKRLYLDEVAEHGSGLEYIPTTFSYQVTTLPFRFSTQQDAWGFFNGNSSKSRIPRIYVYPSRMGYDRYRIYPISGYEGTEYILPGADRRTNTYAVRAGLLSSITFPTGGSRMYEFASNTFYDGASGSNLSGGGLRISRITHHDGIDHANNVLRTYTYGTGRLIAPPIFANETSFFYLGEQLDPTIKHADFVNSDLTKMNQYVSNEFDKWNYFTKRGTHAFNDLTDVEGVSVRYERVTERHTNNGEIVYEFHAPMSYGSNLPGVAEAELNTPDEYWSFKFGGGGTGLYYDSNGYNWGYVRRGALSANPFPPIVAIDNNDLIKGKLKKITVKDESGRVVEETDYDYVIKQKADYEEIHGLRYRHHDLSPGTPSYHYGRRFASYSLYKYKTNIAALREEIVKKDYGTDGDVTGFATTTTFTYNGLTMSPTEVLVDYPDGSASKTTFRYLPDILYGITPPASPGSSVRGLYIWKDLNNISQPLEYVSFQKQPIGGFKINQAVLTLPKKGSDFPSSSSARAFLGEVYSLGLSGNLAAFTPFSMSGNNAITKDSRYYKVMDMLDYDNYGNPLLQQGVDGVTKKYVWGSVYNHSLLTQKIEAFGSGHEQTMTYTHQPLAGILTETDARGLTTYYTYDAYERLIRVRDHELYTLEEYVYNLVNEQ